MITKIETQNNEFIVMDLDLFRDILFEISTAKDYVKGDNTLHSRQSVYKGLDKVYNRTKEVMPDEKFMELREAFKTESLKIASPLKQQS